MIWSHRASRTAPPRTCSDADPMKALSYPRLAPRCGLINVGIDGHRGGSGVSRSSPLPSTTTAPPPLCLTATLALPLPPHSVDSSALSVSPRRLRPPTATPTRPSAQMLTRGRRHCTHWDHHLCMGKVEVRRFADPSPQLIRGTVVCQCRVTFVLVESQIVLRFVDLDLGVPLPHLRIPAHTAVLRRRRSVRVVRRGRHIVNPLFPYKVVPWGGRVGGEAFNRLGPELRHLFILVEQVEATHRLLGARLVCRSLRRRDLGALRPSHLPLLLPPPRRAQPRPRQRRGWDDHKLGILLLNRVASFPRQRRRRRQWGG